MSFWRSDWPAGSNWRLLDGQVRVSTGFTWRGGAATGPTLAGVREAEARRRAGFTLPAVMVAAPVGRDGKRAPVAPVAGVVQSPAAVVLEALRKVRDIRGVLPPDAGLARMTKLEITAVRAGLEALRRDGAIALEMRGTHRAIRLVADKVLLRTAAAPIVEG